MSEVTKLGSKVDYSSQYDRTQLEVFPRAIRRTEFKAPMYGGDIWTCFEVSFLRENGCPEFHILRIMNPADSEYIFESKSLKLYLNSFNNTKFSGIDEVINTIQIDLSQGVKSEVIVKEVINGFKPSLHHMYSYDFLSSELEVDSYTYKPELLEAEEDSDSLILSSNLLRSNCEVTNQPDFANIQIHYESEKYSLSIRSLLKYIVSFRNHQEFHEPTCERIYNDLYNLLQPEKLIVICQYTRRGGIDINPIRTNIKDFDINRLILDLPKQLQQ